MSNALIEHQVAAQRFVLTQEGATALLTYQLNGSNINFDHTFVPPAFRGKGLAEQLVKHALTWAKHEGLTLSASCSYVQRFL